MKRVLNLQKILKTKKLGNFITLHYENFSGQSFIGKHNYFKQTKNYIKRYSLNKNIIVRKIHT